MKKLLVPTDFSPNADKALNFAVQIAKYAKARIILVHACDLLELTFKDRLELKKEYNRKIIAEAKGKLALLKRSIQEAEKVPVITKLYEGQITDTILHSAKVNKADMIVMGTLGRAAVKGKIFGSKTAGVIGKTYLPVLAVPLLSEWFEPGKILLAINNFKEGSEKVIKPVFELAALFNAEVQIAKFTDKSTAQAIDYLSNERKGNSYTRQLQTRFKKSAVQFIHLEGHVFNKTIEKYIDKSKIDMMAMITHKRSFLRSIFSRSKTKKMSYHTKIPLLALPA